MSLVRIFSAVEQVARHLREELIRGQWSGLLPGVDRLAVELGVSRKTVEAALRQLEGEGILVRQGQGRKRSIVQQGGQARPGLRVAVLLSEAADRHLDYLVEFMHELEEKGHTASYAPGSMVELGMDLKRIARLVGGTEADAWVVGAGSGEILEWFCGQATPAFALFGRRSGLPMAGVGPDKRPAMAAAARALMRLGHRRIVLLARPRRRLPKPGESEQVLLDELAAHGLPTGPYNLPDWEESTKGFHARLESLFRMTPPTALIIQEAPFYVAALQFCASRGLRVPQDVSLICTDADVDFRFCQPPVSHIRWDTDPVVRRILRWTDNVSRGKADVRQTLIPAEFVPGGTIGPAKKR